MLGARYRKQLNVCTLSIVHSSSSPFCQQSTVVDMAAAMPFEKNANVYYDRWFVQDCPLAHQCSDLASIATNRNRYQETTTQTKHIKHKTTI
jgi:hypothetical protein